MNEVLQRRAANRLENARQELTALQAVAANFNLFTDNEVLRCTRLAIAAAQAHVDALTKPELCRVHADDYRNCWRPGGHDGLHTWEEQ